MHDMDLLTVPVGKTSRRFLEGLNVWKCLSEIKLF